MHDADVYGVLRWTLVEVATAIGCPVKVLRELADKGVLKGTDRGRCEPYVYVPRSGGRDGEPVTLVAAQKGPVWYSSRMVRDEHVRKRRGEASRFVSGIDGAPKGTPKAAPMPAPIPPFRDGSSSSSSSSSSEKTSVFDGEHGLQTRVFQLGRQLLTESGTSEKAAGSLIGKLRKDYGDAAVLAALETAQRERVSDPAAWLVKTCSAASPRGRKSLAFGAQNYEAGWGRKAK